MKRVYKYKLAFVDLSTLELPKGAEILTINEQNRSVQGNIDPYFMVWALVDPAVVKTEKRQFRIAGTGHTIFESNLHFINTVFLDDVNQVYHIFEVK